MTDTRTPTLWDLPVSPEGPDGDALRVAHAIVETPRDSSNKYEYDPELLLFKLDRVLANSVHFPGDYGFIPSTIAEDGEPLDILLVATGPSTPGMLILARPIGVVEVLDGGVDDAKIVAVAVGEPRHAAVHDIGDLGSHRVREIEHFFNIYKGLGMEAVDPAQSVVGWRSAEDARRRIEEAHRRYLSRMAGA